MSMLKTAVLLIIVVEIRILWLLEKSKEQHLFELEIFCNLKKLQRIMKVLTHSLSESSLSLFSSILFFFTPRCTLGGSDS